VDELQRVLRAVLGFSWEWGYGGAW
jgi:hypothetical protein